MISHLRGTLDWSEVISAESLFFRYLHEIYSSAIQNHHVLPFALQELQYISFKFHFVNVSPKNKINMRQQTRLLLTYNKSIELTIQKQIMRNVLVLTFDSRLWYLGISECSLTLLYICDFPLSRETHEKSFPFSFNLI